MEYSQDKIAIVGMACMFPAASDLAEYWQLVITGADAITEIPSTHWNPQDYYNADPHKPDMTYARRGGFLKPYPFDPLKFGIAPHTIEATDTSQLLGMVVAHEALCDAGYGPQREFDRDRVSCVVGVTGTLELVIPLSARLGHPIWRRALTRAGVDPAIAEQVIGEISGSYVGWQESSFPGLLGNVVAGRMASRLNLGGTNAVVDAACGSSLGALHVAAMELLSQRADMVVTGGVDTFNDIFMYMCFSKTPALSPTGDARPFDKEADGTILGEGVGIVVLKRLSDAQKAGDRIYAVISGIGTSSDGRGQAIYAPNSKGQAKALRRAYQEAGVTPEAIGLIEAHGTGTKAGDVAEMAALLEVYRAAQPSGSWCALGSVKSQIGHTKAAAGVAGLIKTALALYHKVLPPTIKIREPMAELHGSPFFLNECAQPWVAHPTLPRRAAVSSFGFGGSNFHCVLEEAAAGAPGGAGGEQYPQILAFSHAHLDGLKALALDFCKETIDPAAWRCKAAQSREQFCAKDPYRLVLVCHAREQASLGARLAAALGCIDDTMTTFQSPDGIYYGRGPREGRLAFLFPGQGAQYPGMLRDLALRFPTMMRALDQASRLFGINDDGQTLGRLIYPPRPNGAQEKDLQQLALRDTKVAQIAIGAVSAGACDLLRDFGVEPDLVAGHSFGELTALYAAGVYEQEGLLALALLRGRLMAEAALTAGGAMAALGADHAQTASLMARVAGGELWMANLNGPAQTVVAGSASALDQLESICAGAKVRFQRLQVSAAFHSPLVAAACTPFAEGIAALPMQPPRLDVYANASAEIYPQQAAAMQDLLVEQIVKPVRFSDEVAAMLKARADIFVEVGPSAQLTGLCAAATLAGAQKAVFLSLDAPARASSRDGLVQLARLLAQLSARGVPVDLAKWDRPEEALAQDKSDALQPRFTVSLCGANHAPSLQKGPQQVVTSARADKPHMPSVRPEAQNELLPLSRSEVRQENRASTIEFKEHGMQLNPVTKGACDDALVNALARAHESLLALQKMQQDNAAIHQKFLEGQAESQKMFYELIRLQQEMMRSGAVGTGPALPLAGESMAASDARGAPDQSRWDEAAWQRSPVSGSFVAPSSQPPLVEPASPKTVQQAPQSAEKSVHERTLGQAVPTREELAAAILEVLTAKTGYPGDMIQRDMDLEADLGIDSIKRVEIFAALGEKMAVFAALTPGMTGGLRSINEILAALSAGGAGAPTTEALHAPTAVEPVNAVPPEALAEVVLGRPAPARADLERSVVAVIADKTGYPAEMLTPAMHLENDLGIDSIKRVEIFSALSDVVGGSALQEAGRSAVWATINDIVDGLQGLAEDSSPKPCAADEAAHAVAEPLVPRETGKQAHHDTIYQAPCPSMEPCPSSKQLDPQTLPRENVQAPAGQANDHHAIWSGEHPAVLQTPTLAKVDSPVEVPPSSLLQRFVVAEKPLSPEAVCPATPLAPASRIWVLDDGSELSSMVMGVVKRRGGKPRLVDLDYLDRIEEPSAMDGLIALAPAYRDEQEAERYLSRFFGLCTFLAKLFDKALGGKRRFVAAVTRQGGRFGMDGIANRATCYYGGLSGLVKCAAQEWAEVSCKLIDIDDAAASLEQMAERIVDASLQEGELEIGLAAQQSYGVSVQPVPLMMVEPSDEALTIGLGDVVVVSGGARGVTAEVAIKLAERCQPTMLVLGRSREPSAEEPAWLSQITDDAAIKAALLTHAAPGTSLAQIHEQYERLLNDRAMTQTFARIRQAGAVLIYRCVDIRQRQAVLDVVQEIRQNVGPIRGIIHGAGVLRDRLLKDKTDEQFAEVMATKVAGFCHLMEAVDPSTLRLIALFSSSSARYGRRGQGDYAAANEILNKFAQYYRRELTHCHVVALDFGPWQGGMVNPSLARLFQSEGIGLIPLEAGAKLVVDEMVLAHASARRGSAEVVIMGSLGVEHKAAAEPVVPVTQPTGLFSWEISLAQQPLLAHHIIGGRIVVPVVLLIEWLGHAALHGNPGLLFHGFDDLRVLKGIVLGAEDVRKMRAYALSSVRNGELFEVYTEIRSIDARGVEVRHASCKVVLAQRLPQATASSIHLTFAEPYGRTREQVYEQMLFHGEQLMGMEKIMGINARGCTIKAKAAPVPAEWLSQPLRGHWLADPLILDSAFQAVVVWARECAGSASLPCAIRSYRQFYSSFPPEGCLVAISAQRHGEKLVKADCEFSAPNGGLIARMESYEAVMDPTLNEAFRKRVCGHTVAAVQGAAPSHG